MDEKECRSSERRFSVEDVEKAARAFMASAFPNAGVGVTSELRRNMRAALDALEVRMGE